MVTVMPLLFAGNAYISSGKYFLLHSSAVLQLDSNIL